MISSYRLGDLVMVTLNNNEENELKTDFPDSIGAEYILKRKQLRNDIDTIIDIVKERIKKYENLFPADIENSTVIHLRLGDVVSGNEIHEKQKRPLDIEYYKNIIDPTQKIYVIGKCFFAKPSSKNYDECIQKSKSYQESILKTFNAELFDSNSADIDLCFAVKSKLFIQGKGYYSALITEIRKKLNLKTIETSITNY